MTEGQFILQNILDADAVLLSRAVVLAGAYLQSGYYFYGCLPPSDPEGDALGSKSARWQSVGGDDLCSSFSLHTEALQAVSRDVAACPRSSLFSTYLFLHRVPREIRVLLTMQTGGCWRTRRTSIRVSLSKVTKQRKQGKTNEVVIDKKK